MIRTLFVLLALASGITPPLEAQESEGRWKPVYEDNNVHTDLDTIRIQEQDGVVKMWLRWTFTNPPETLPDLRRMVTQEEFDCNRDLSRMTEWVYYNDRGELLGSRADPEAAWESVVPASRTESMYAIVCVLYVNSTQAQ